MNPHASALLLLGLLAGCADPRPTLLITVMGLSSDVRALDVQARLNGVAAREPMRFTGNLYQFAVRLPPDAVGSLELTIEGLDKDLCSAATGSLRAELDQSPLRELTVILSHLDATLCSLELDLRGLRQGVTFSTTPSGVVPRCDQPLPCEQDCRCAVPKGTQVALFANPLDADPRIARPTWSGDCVAGDPAPTACSLIMNRGAKVTTDMRHGSCSPDRLCLEFPLEGDPQLNLRAAFARGVDDVWAVGSGGQIIHWNGKYWARPGKEAATTSSVTRDLYSVWASSAKDVWATGKDRTAVHWDGTEWKPQTAGLDTIPGDVLTALWGTGPGDVWVNSINSRSWLRWDGSRWAEAGAQLAARSAWVTGPTDAWAVGDSDGLQHWDGARWTQVPGGPTQSQAVWASGPTDVWVANYAGSIARWNGAEWTNRLGMAERVDGLWGSGPSDVWAAGGRGQILRWGGTSWMALQHGGSESLVAVTGSGPGDVWVVGNGVGGGTIRRYRPLPDSERAH